MSKVIVIKNCEDCLYCINDSYIYMTDSSYFCQDYHCYKTGMRVYDGMGIPEHCPLPDPPEKELLWHDDEQDDYALGWNACLNTILGENKDEKH